VEGVDDGEHHEEGSKEKEPCGASEGFEGPNRDYLLTVNSELARIGLTHDDSPSGLEEIAARQPFAEMPVRQHIRLQLDER
jgi:hypothetical protein